MTRTDINFCVLVPRPLAWLYLLCLCVCITNISHCLQVLTMCLLLPLHSDYISFLLLHCICWICLNSVENENQKGTALLLLVVSEDRLRPLSVDGPVVMCYIVIFKSMYLFLFYVCTCFACTPVHAAWRPGEGAGSLGTRAIDSMLWAAMWSSMTQTQSLCQSSKGSKPSLQSLFLDQIHARRLLS